MKPTVVYWNNMPSPYMVDRFNAIARKGDIDFQAWFNTEREADRDWDVIASDWRFSAAYLPSEPVAQLREVYRRLRENRPDVLVTLYGSPAFAAGIVLAKAMGIKVVLRALKTFDTWRPRTQARTLAKRLLFPRMDGIHVAGPDSQEYVSSFGARPANIFRFPEPVNVDHFALGADQARILRKPEPGLLVAQCVFLYVGRLWRGKGLDYLMEAYQRLQSEGADIGMILVGTGSDHALYGQMAATMTNVMFAGFVQETDLPRWYGLSDVLVFPTLGDPYGHVVQEAMASSLAVIATESAGDIRDRVLEGLTGYVVPAADSGTLYSRMKLLASNPQLRRQMGLSGYEAIRSRTVEWWAGEFGKMIHTLQPDLELAA